MSAHSTLTRDTESAESRLAALVSTRPAGILAGEPKPDRASGLAGPHNRGPRVVLQLPDVTVAPAVDPNAASRRHNQLFWLAIAAGALLAVFLIATAENTPAARPVDDAPAWTGNSGLQAESQPAGQVQPVAPAVANNPSPCVDPAQSAPAGITTSVQP